MDYFRLPGSANTVKKHSSIGLFRPPISGHSVIRERVCRYECCVDQQRDHHGTVDGFRPMPSVAGGKLQLHDLGDVPANSKRSIHRSRVRYGERFEQCTDV
jgi:hypothetical protein